MQAVPSSIGPKKGRTELERTKDKLLGISQKHNDVVINNVSHRQRIRELEEELFNLRDECQGLRERNTELLARLSRAKSGGLLPGDPKESQMLLHLVTTLLAATPALAQLQTQLQQVSSSAPAAAPAPFQHWTPKLNPPGNVKASAEPIGIEGVTEEDEDEENLASASSAQQSTNMFTSTSTSSLSSIASSTSSRSIRQQAEETMDHRSQSRTARASRRSSGLLPPPSMPVQFPAPPLPRSNTLDNLPDMEDEWMEEPLVSPAGSIDTREIPLTPTPPTTSAPLADLTPVPSKTASQSSRPPVSNRPEPSSSKPLMATTRKITSNPAAPPPSATSASQASRKPPLSSSSSASRPTKPSLPSSSISSTSSSSSSSRTSTSSSTASATSATRRPSAPPPVLKTRPAAPTTEPKPRPPTSSNSSFKPLATSTAGNLAVATSLPPTKGSLPGVKMKDVAEAMRAVAKASTPPPSASYSPTSSDPSTPMRSLSLVQAMPQSATSTATLGSNEEESQESENGRRMGRARKSVNYKEPSLNTKMRNPDATVAKKTKARASATKGMGVLPGDEDDLADLLPAGRPPAVVLPTSSVMRRKSVLLKRGVPPKGPDYPVVEYELTSDDDDDDGSEDLSGGGSDVSEGEEQEDEQEEDHQATPRAFKVITPAPRPSASDRRDSGMAPEAGGGSRRTSHRFSVGVGS